MDNTYVLTISLRTLLQNIKVQIVCYKCQTSLMMTTEAPANQEENIISLFELWEREKKIILYVQTHLWEIYSEISSSNQNSHI